MNKGVAIALAVGIAAAAGFFAQRMLGPTAPTSTAAAPPPLQAEQTEAVQTESVPKIPDTLPQFELADRDGRKRSLADWAGQPLMVNYWATWCAPCRREIPLLNQLRAEHQAQRLEVIGIAVDFRDDVLKYAQETVIDYPLLIGEEDGLEAVKAMGMQPAFPFTVFADSQQRILTLKIGELHRDEAELILGKLAAVEAGLDLKQAQDEISAGLKEIATRRAAAKPPAG